MLACRYRASISATYHDVLEENGDGRPVKTSDCTFANFSRKRRHINVQASSGYSPCRRKMTASLHTPPTIITTALADSGDTPRSLLNRSPPPGPQLDRVRSRSPPFIPSATSEYVSWEEEVEREERLRNFLTMSLGRCDTGSTPNHLTPKHTKDQHPCHATCPNPQRTSVSAATLSINIPPHAPHQ